MNTSPTSSQWRELIDQHLLGTISLEESVELEAALVASREAREDFRRRCNIDAALRQQASLQMESSDADKDKVTRVWVSPTLTAAAAGLVFGIFCTSMAWAYVGPYAGRAMTLWQDGFESGITETLPGLPRKTGMWSGDEARVVASEAGLKPKSGVKMMRFVSATFAGENAKQSAWGDVYRLVDLRGQVSDGKSVLRLSASFDAMRFPAGEEYSCFVELCALESDLAYAPQPLALPWVRENSASVTARKFPMKGDGVWQEVRVEAPVSPQTRFILVHLAIQRRKPNPSVEPVQFGGHYLDDVKLELLTQPPTP